MIFDYFNFAINGIRNRKMRSWLTMIGIFIGITAVVALISIGQGMQAAIDEQFKIIGSNRITVSPGGGGLEGGSSMLTSGLVSAKLTDDDLDFIRKIRGVEFAAGPVIRPVKVKFGEEVKYITSMNLPTDSEAIKFFKTVEFFIIEEGNYVTGDGTDKVTVGYETAHSTFKNEIKVGDKIFIEDRKFEVVGIYKKSGNPVHDNKVSMSIDTAREMFGMGDEVSSIFVTVKDGFDVTEVADGIEKDLRKHRGLKEGEEDFSVATAEQMVGVFKDLLLVIQLVLVGIAAISLIVGGIGIMTTMYTSVIERTREIGIMKSIGAKNSDIGLIFLIESGLLGVAGGIIGIILGLTLSFSVQLAAQAAGLDIMKAYVSVWLIAGALLFSFFVGTISGVLPAMQASKMKPVDALRHR
jgi:putative ABC transport system permease protein